MDTPTHGGATLDFVWETSQVTGGSVQEHFGNSYHGSIILNVIINKDKSGPC